MDRNSLTRNGRKEGVEMEKAPLELTMEAFCLKVFV